MHTQSVCGCERGRKEEEIQRDQSIEKERLSGEKKKTQKQKDFSLKQVKHNELPT